MRKKQLKDFWNDEYRDPGYFALSTVVSSDLEKWVRWMQKEYGKDVFRPGLRVLDLGCGNGRNLIHLCKQFGMTGVGYDISEEGIRQAKAAALEQKVKAEFFVQSIGDPISLPDGSVDIVLDMMASHFLKEVEREQYRSELLRVLAPDGFLFFKSFYAKGDLHAKNLIKEHSGGEESSYIHPTMKVYEYVWTDEAIEAFFGPYFTLLHQEASHRHFNKGKPNKRRSIVCYFEKR